MFATHKQLVFTLIKNRLSLKQPIEGISLFRCILIAYVLLCIIQVVSIDCAVRYTKLTVLNLPSTPIEIN